MYYKVKTPQFIKGFFNGLTWDIQANGNKDLYLTFDDGPNPKITSWILDVLDKFDAQATFFCIGKKTSEYGSLFEDIHLRGHAHGNHTFSHLNAWQVSRKRYIEDVDLCEKQFQARLFRPPYGRITPALVTHLKDRFQIIMWDVVSGDFDPKISPQDCLNNIIDNSAPGSIVVLHDNYNAEKRMKYALEGTLNHFAEKGYRFKRL